MGLLDTLKSREDGVKGSADGTGGGVPSWRPAKERAHPDAIEGVIAEVGVAKKREPKEGGPTEDHVIVVKTPEEAWKVYGSVRDLHDRFETLKSEGLLVPGTTIAVKFFGTRKETAKDGTPYSVHSYAVAAEKHDGKSPIPKITGRNDDGTPIWEETDPPF